jgi:hypothetical protein
MYAGVRLTGSGRSEWEAVKADPVRELDRFLRTATPLAKRFVRMVRTRIDV